MIWLTVVVFVVLLLLLVLVHEWGHFFAAKRAGCRVEEFGFGFPPRLFSWEWRGTRYSLNALPIGGFVKIEGEDMQQHNNSPTNFANKSATWRIVILAAGVVMNVVLAVVLLTFQAGIGYPTLVTEETEGKLRDAKTYLVEVAAGSPAEQAGLKAFDRIALLNGLANPTIEQIREAAAVGTPVSLEIERQGQHQTITITPRINPPPGEGALGVSLAATGLQKVPWWQAPWAGVKRTGEMLWAIGSQFVAIVRQLVSQGNVGGSLTGPIGIAVYANEATKLGLSYLLEFGALISLNLAIVNILPLPALDGGRIVFVILEKLRRGRRLPARFEELTHTVGFVLLILLMVLITLKDIRKYF